MPDKILTPPTLNKPNYRASIPCGTEIGPGERIALDVAGATVAGTAGAVALGSAGLVAGMHIGANVLGTAGAVGGIETGPGDIVTTLVGTAAGGVGGAL